MKTRIYSLASRWSLQFLPCWGRGVRRGLHKNLQPPEPAGFPFSFPFGPWLSCIIGHAASLEQMWEEKHWLDGWRWRQTGQRCPAEGRLGWQDVVLRWETGCMAPWLLARLGLCLPMFNSSGRLFNLAVFFSVKCRAYPTLEQYD